MDLNKSIFALFCSLLFLAACGGNGEPAGKPDGGSTDGQVVTNPCKDAASRCDDKVACTRDSCDENTGDCRHQADHALCSAGTVCMPKEGCKSPPPCATDADCPDTDNGPCMQEYCEPASSTCRWNPLDKDGDGHAPQICADIGGDDCDDDDSSVHPGAEEVCNEVDEDCDGIIDNIKPGVGYPFYRDEDGDGYGNPDVMKEACSPPDGYVGNAEDCNDLDVNITQCIPPATCVGGVSGICCTPQCADKCGGPDGCGGNCHGPFTDSISELTWQNPPAEGEMTWQDAMNYCENLTSCGHQDWRLPTISELRSLIRGCPNTESGGMCGVTDSCLDLSCLNEPCNGCYGGQGPADGCYWPNEIEGECRVCWSSSSYARASFVAWHVGFPLGYVNGLDKSFHYYVRCVRGGP